MLRLKRGKKSYLKDEDLKADQLNNDKQYDQLLSLRM